MSQALGPTPGAAPAPLGFWHALVSTPIRVWEFDAAHKLANF